VSWRTTTDAGEFFAEAGGYLQADPVENTLLLTIADGARGSATPVPAGAGPLFGGRDSPRAGTFVHSPGWPVVLSPMTEAAAAGLAVTLYRLGRVVTGVNGAPAVAGAFAAQWCHTAGPAATSRVFQRQRLFRLGELTPPPPPAGRARVATAGDRQRLVQWADAFHREAHEGGHPNSAAVVDGRLAYDGALYQRLGYHPVSDRVVLFVAAG
jgi:hypothetical protein